MVDERLGSNIKEARWYGSARFGLIGEEIFALLEEITTVVTVLVKLHE
jgi:hypothetical protein